MAEESAPRFLYFPDTMCSWCYAFAPAMDRVLEHFAGRVKLILFSGGLRPFNTEPLSEAWKDKLRDVWRDIEAMTGQPFDFEFFAREGFVSDTEPASRAVVTMRAIKQARAYDYMARIQSAFFAANEDIRQPMVLAGHAAHFGVDGQDFLTAFNSQEMRQTTLNDFAMARKFDVQGFPTLILEKDGQFTVIARGFAGVDHVIGTVEQVLAA